MESRARVCVCGEGGEGDGPHTGSSILSLPLSLLKRRPPLLFLRRDGQRGERKGGWGGVGGRKSPLCGRKNRESRPNDPENGEERRGSGRGRGGRGSRGKKTPALNPHSFSTLGCQAEKRGEGRKRWNEMWLCIHSARRRRGRKCRRKKEGLSMQTDIVYYCTSSSHVTHSQRYRDVSPCTQGLTDNFFSLLFFKKKNQFFASPPLKNRNKKNLHFLLQKPRGGLFLLLVTQSVFLLFLLFPGNGRAVICSFDLTFAQMGRRKRRRRRRKSLRERGRPFPPERGFCSKRGEGGGVEA